MSAGPAPTPESFSMPVGETRYRSSLPTDSPTTRSVKAVPYFAIALLSAASSFVIVGCPAEAQMPRRRDVFVLMAAGMASMGSDTEVPCY
jgi:hypothetical protein